jgi:glycosyltransferase 2 family protein
VFGRARIIGVLITVLFLGLSFWRVDMSEVGRALSAGDYRFVIPATFVTFIGYLIRTFRWRRFLAPSKSIPFRSLVPVLMIGFMANNILPARMGEFVRAYALNRQESVSKSLALATIMLERVFDGLTLILFLVVLSLVFPLPVWGTEAAIVATALFAAAVFGAILLLTHEALAIRVLRTVLTWAPDHLTDLAEQKARSFTLGLEALRRPDAVFRIALLSIVVWSLEASSYFFLISGFSLGLTGTQPIWAAIFTLIIVNLGIMLPSAPGYVGTFQFFVILALGAFGVGREAALSIAIVSHVMQYVLVTGLGLLFLARMNLSLSGLREARARDAEGRLPS